MARLYTFKFFSNLFLVVSVLSLVIFPEPAFAWAAIKSDSWATSDLTTHQSMLQIAYDRLFDDIAIKDQKDKFPDQNAIKSWEGVWVASSTSGLWWGAFTKGGPDAGEVSSDSEHYYNPKNPPSEAGKAPDSVKAHYALLLEQIYTKAVDLASDRGAKNASWAAHYLADIHVPYHTVGVPTERVTMGNQTVLSANEFGSYLLCYPGELKFNAECLADPQSIKEPKAGWGKSGDFRWEIESYKKYNSENYSRHAEYRDWFDPWYYNGTTLLSRSVQIGTGSHAQWEKSTHNYLLSNNNMLVKPKAYSTDWKNATPSFDVPFSTHLANQAQQAQLFTIAAATETRANLLQYLCMRSVPANKAIERMTTLWRASLTALRPSLTVTPDSSNPKLLKVIAIIGSAEPNDPAQNVQAKLTVTGGTIRGNAIQGIKEAITPNSPRPLNWEVDSPNPDACKLKLEVICNYQKTPDLQYAVAEPNQINVEVSPNQVHAGDKVKLTIKVQPSEKTELTVTNWGPLEGKTDLFSFLGKATNLTTDGKGTFTGDFTVSKSAKDGSYDIKVEAGKINPAGSAKIYVGLNIKNSAGVYIRFMTNFKASYANKSGTYTVQSLLSGDNPQTKITSWEGDYTVNAIMVTAFPNEKGTLKITLDNKYETITSFTWEYRYENPDPTVKSVSTTITGGGLKKEGKFDSPIAPLKGPDFYYKMTGEAVCTNIKVKSTRVNNDGTTEVLTGVICNPNTICDFLFQK